jgi:hypothetical protein
MHTLARHGDAANSAASVSKGAILKKPIDTNSVVNEIHP